MSEWRKIITVGEMPMHRTGWRGAWDSVVAAISGEPLRTVNGTVTFSVWVKTDQEVRLEIARAQVEIAEQKNAA